MYNDFQIYERTVQLIGEEAFEKLQQTRVLLFGAGGVGGWCAEALIRTGIGKLSIVDFDTVAPSNLNRQLVATQDTLGKPKAEALANAALSFSDRVKSSRALVLYSLCVSSSKSEMWLSAIARYAEPMTAL